MKIGIVTCAKCSNLTDSERPLIPLLKERDVEAIPLIWNDDAVSWESYDFLLIRSIWDYHLYPEAFHAWLDKLEKKSVVTLNSSSILRRNAHKFYLRNLEGKGVQIVPTLFQDKGTRETRKLAASKEWHRVVVKPAISASAYRTETVDVYNKHAEEIFNNASAHGDFLVQEFMSAVQESGELSIIFFNLTYSHTVLKRPRSGEFRVQKEYGGDAIPHHPDQSVIQTAKNILYHFGGEPLYARVDGIVEAGKFILMELELIEPDLFLGAHPDAHDRFVGSIMERIQRA